MSIHKSFQHQKFINLNFEILRFLVIDTINYKII